MSTSSPPSLSLHAVDDTYRLATWNEVVLVDWHLLPTTDRLRRFEGVIRLAAQGETKATPLVRLRPNLGTPPAEIRDEITRVMRDTERLTNGWAVLLEGDGFWAATHRSLTSTMHLLSGSRVKLRVFKTAPEAAVWVVQLCGRHHPSDITTFLSAADGAALSA